MSAVFFHKQLRQVRLQRKHSLTSFFHHLKPSDQYVPLGRLYDLRFIPQCHTRMTLTVLDSICTCCSGSVRHWYVGGLGWTTLIFGGKCQRSWQWCRVRNHVLWCCVHPLRFPHLAQPLCKADVGGIGKFLRSRHKLVSPFKLPLYLIRWTDECEVEQVSKLQSVACQRHLYLFHGKAQQTGCLPGHLVLIRSSRLYIE